MLVQQVSVDEKRLCGIPAKTLPPCDLPWGHAGEQHANCGDGFYAREHAEEHARRQKETGNLPKPMFHFSISYDVSYSVEEIWPDGDAPENPTLDDVLAVIKKDGGKRAILNDWSMTEDLGLSVSDGKTTKDVV